MNNFYSTTRKTFSFCEVLLWHLFLSFFPVSLLFPSWFMEKTLKSENHLLRVSGKKRTMIGLQSFFLSLRLMHSLIISLPLPYKKEWKRRLAKGWMDGCGCESFTFSSNCCLFIQISFQVQQQQCPDLRPSRIKRQEFLAKKLMRGKLIETWWTMKKQRSFVFRLHATKFSQAFLFCGKKHSNCCVTKCYVMPLCRK